MKSLLAVFPITMLMLAMPASSADGNELFELAMQWKQGDARQPQSRAISRLLPRTAGFLTAAAPPRAAIYPADRLSGHRAHGIKGKLRLSQWR